MSIKEILFEKINLFTDKHNDFDNEHICQQFIVILDEFKERTINPHEIIDLFFLENIFYYNPTSNLYIQYNNSVFTMINENEFINTVLNYLTIHRNEYLLDTQTKHTLQYQIQKITKTKIIYDVIPDSSTLQSTLSFFYPNLFDDKSYAKYFLIIIGDMIMKKTKCIYFVPTFIKTFLQQVNKYISLYFHSINIFQWFKFKYTDHDQEISRIIKMNSLNMNFFNLQQPFFVNMICVCIHYSCRYCSGEDFLNEMMPELKQDILWINIETKEQMVQTFITEYIIDKPNCVIDEKDMYFLWKSYLSKNGKLNIFQKKQDLYDLVSQFTQVRHNKFINVYSMFLPHVETFKDFWDKYTYVDNDEYDFELNELYIIYSEIYKCKMSESIFKDLIEFYYPNVVILEDKLIKHIGCTLWNKKKELESYVSKEGDVNNLYQFYCKEFKSKRKVSKQYFTQYYYDFLIK